MLFPAKKQLFPPGDRVRALAAPLTLHRSLLRCPPPLPPTAPAAREKFPAGLLSPTHACFCGKFLFL